MSDISSNLINSKRGGVGGIAQFSQGARTFVREFNVCPARVATTQDGRLASAGSVNSLTAPGCFSPLPIIQNENSLRPVLASNPQFKNVQLGVGGGASTLFGLKVPGQANTLDMTYDMAVQMGNPSKKCDPMAKYYSEYPYDPSFDGKDCVNDRMVPAYTQRNSDTLAPSILKANNFML
jgi:hypothetical protein